MISANAHAPGRGLTYSCVRYTSTSETFKLSSAPLFLLTYRFIALLTASIAVIY